MVSGLINMAVHGAGANNATKATFLMGEERLQSSTTFIFQYRYSQIKCMRTCAWIALHTHLTVFHGCNNVTARFGDLKQLVHSKLKAFAYKDFDDFDDYCDVNDFTDVDAFDDFDDFDDIGDFNYFDDFWGF